MSRERGPRALPRASSATCASLPDDLGENPFPASLEVTLKPGHQSPAEVERLVRDFEKAPGVRGGAVRPAVDRAALHGGAPRARGRARSWAGILVLAGVFTISNVIRLTVYAREDELDIMRLVGATQAYVKGPFVVEGMIQGGLGGLLAVGLLWLAFRWLAARLAGRLRPARPRAGRAAAASSASLLVLGGMAVGVAGSLVSLRRRQRV